MLKKLFILMLLVMVLPVVSATNFNSIQTDPNSLHVVQSNEVDKIKLKGYPDVHIKYSVNLNGQEQSVYDFEKEAKKEDTIFKPFRKNDINIEKKQAHSKEVEFGYEFENIYSNNMNVPYGVIKFENIAEEDVARITVGGAESGTGVFQFFFYGVIEFYFHPDCYAVERNWLEYEIYGDMEKCLDPFALNTDTLIRITGAEITNTSHIYTQDLAGQRELIANTSTPYDGELTNQVRPADSIELKVDVIVSSFTTAGSVNLTGVDWHGNTVSENVTVSGAGTTTTTNYFKNITNVNATGTFDFSINQSRWGCIWDLDAMSFNKPNVSNAGAWMIDCTIQGYHADVELHSYNEAFIMMDTHFGNRWTGGETFIGNELGLSGANGSSFAYYGDARYSAVVNSGADSSGNVDTYMYGTQIHHMNRAVTENWASCFSKGGYSYISEVRGVDCINGGMGLTGTRFSNVNGFGSMGINAFSSDFNSVISGSNTFGGMIAGRSWYCSGNQVIKQISITETDRCQTVSAMGGSGSSYVKGGLVEDAVVGNGTQFRLRFGTNGNGTWHWTNTLLMKAVDGNGDGVENVSCLLTDEFGNNFSTDGVEGGLGHFKNSGAFTTHATSLSASGGWGGFDDGDTMRSNINEYLTKVSHSGNTGTVIRNVGNDGGVGIQNGSWTQFQGYLVNTGNFWRVAPTVSNASGDFELQRVTSWSCGNHVSFTTCRQEKAMEYFDLVCTGGDGVTMYDVNKRITYDQWAQMTSNADGVPFSQQVKLTIDVDNSAIKTGSRYTWFDGESQTDYSC